MINKEESDSLEERVRERTKELAGMTESLKKEVVKRQHAEGEAKANAQRAAALAAIIHVLNEAADLPALYEHALNVVVTRLEFKGGFIATVSDTDRIDVQAAYRLPSELVKAYDHTSVDSNPYTSKLFQQHKLFELDEVPPDSIAYRYGLRGAAVGIPFVSEGNTVGNIALYAEHPWSFTEGDRQLFSAIGEEFGTAVAKLTAKHALKESEAQLKQYAQELEDRIGERTAELAQSEEEFRTLFEESSIAQIRYDVDGRPIRANDAARSLLGITDASALQRFTIFSSPRIPEKAKTQLRAGHPIQFELPYDFDSFKERGAFETTRSGVKYLYVYALPLFSTSRDRVEGYFIQYIDVTEQKRAEAALKESERLAGIGQTAAMIGHDLRNPLQALLYILDLENTYFDAIPPEIKAHLDSVKAKQLLKTMAEQIRYMDKIVSDLQDYARPLQLEAEEVHLTEFVTGALALLTIPESVRVKIDIPGEITATIDSHLMQRALSNLILNAVQAMPDGGALMFGAATKNDAVALTIQDTGIGIPADMRDKLFSPLTTGKAKGTGLGLAVVKRIVEAHNGTITFASEEGKGTTFTVTLPQTAA